MANMRVCLGESVAGVAPSDARSRFGRTVSGGESGSRPAGGMGRVVLGEWTGEDPDEGGAGAVWRDPMLAGSLSKRLFLELGSAPPQKAGGNPTGVLLWRGTAVGQLGTASRGRWISTPKFGFPHRRRRTRGFSCRQWTS